MDINHLTALAATLLAISLAAERLVTVLKTLIPKRLAGNGTGDEEDPENDRVRRVLVQVIAFLAAWVTAAFLAEGGGFSPFGQLVISSAASAGDPGFTFRLPILLVAFLGSGGSALWSSVLGYSKAVKDLRIQARASNTDARVAKDRLDTRVAAVNSEAARAARSQHIRTALSGTHPALDT